MRCINSHFTYFVVDCREGRGTGQSTTMMRQTTTRCLFVRMTWSRTWRSLMRDGRWAPSWAAASVAWSPRTTSSPLTEITHLLIYTTTFPKLSFHRTQRMQHKGHNWCNVCQATNATKATYAMQRRTSAHGQFPDNVVDATQRLFGATDTHNAGKYICSKRERISLALCITNASAVALRMWLWLRSLPGIHCISCVLCVASVAFDGN